MFTKKVTDSDSFISLSASAQALYLHLCQSADDDGFNNQVQSAMYKAHACVDDVKVLLAKRFIIQFDSGVIVIKHWRMHNALRKDRYTPTAFQEELAMLKLKDNDSYTLSNEDDGCQMVAKWLPNGCQMVATGKESIGKESKGKLSIAKDSIGEVIGEDDSLSLFNEFWKIYPKKVGKTVAYKSFLKINPSRELLNQMLLTVSFAKETEQWQKEGGRYIPNPSTWLNQGRWEDDISTYQQKKKSVIEIGMMMGEQDGL